MLIKNVSVLLGKELDFVPKIDIKIQDSRFKQIKSNIETSTKDETFDCEGLLLIPGFVNCHTHIGDSIGKDVILNSSVDKRIHPVSGVKPLILKNTEKNHLASFMKYSCQSMMNKGITTFVDFREGGLEGVLLLKQILSKLQIRGIILGRLEFYQGTSEIKKNKPISKTKMSELVELLKKCDGIGVSGANENSSSVLNYYSSTPKLRVIHSSETKQSVSKSKKITGISETTRALTMKPHFLVHMTHASLNDLRSASKKTSGIVICPRANAALAEGIPDIELMKKAGCIIALGTDNVMINSPDMFREMDYLWKVTMGLHKKRIEPKEILKMATVNGGKILNKDIGVIEIGKLADGIFINKHALDLEPMHNIHASIVHRASESNIRAVMIGGKITHGKI
ncbi:MAG: amidohydrolase family protein [Nitrosarchaeum sp.]|jgi:cytosine/adenosine deaminase-related metal-dependent hydrolase|uniref:amidohydrolase family protein n=1 Tax=Nitrosarchaeum sp. TaxID=2026886 RepID=UPI002DF57616|nr:amidohydrolase family protein [Nitrosarchaeum sp.]MEC4849243.1 amidohydrolase family protein [Nitrosarchaeum sp.]